MKSPASSTDSLAARLARAALLLALVTVNWGYFSGLHLHVLPDGRIIAHSHPVEGRSPAGEHEHSNRDYVVHGEQGKLLQTVLSNLAASTHNLPSAVIGLLPFQHISETKPVSESVQERAPPVG